VTHLYYVRHGESIINAKGIWANVIGSPFDLGLSELGKQQAAAAGQTCLDKKLSFDLFVVSPMQRTRETAAIIGDIINFPTDKIIYNPLLTERKYAGLEGSSFHKFFEDHDYKDLDTVPGNETLEQLQIRAAEALAYLKQLPAEIILVVGHAAFGRALQRAILGRPYTDEYEGTTDATHDSIDIPHGKVVKLI